MLQEKYRKEIVNQLGTQLGIKNAMRIPRLVKIAVNSSTAEATQNAKVMEKVAQELLLITGQKPKLCRAKKSIATFKLREGMPIGSMVTLRGKNMYYFFTRLVNIVLPRVRDFKGLSKKGFDGRGNYTLGITEQIVFPEISSDKVDKVRGFNVTLVTSAHTDKEGEALLKALGLPLKT